MNETPLTVIERELVLQYLKDANVPVTITALRSCSSSTDAEDASPSAVFPVAARGTEGEQNVIELQNPPQQVKDFAGKEVRVEFYFNKMGLAFTSRLSPSKEDSPLRLALPESVYRIQERVPTKDTAFTCNIYYSCSNNAKVNFQCISEKEYALFCTPVWKDIAVERQYLAKTYLERFVKAARANGAYNNGLFLIPICRYLTDSNKHLSSIEGRIEPFTALYVDSERLVFGWSPAVFPKRPSSLPDGIFPVSTQAAGEIPFPLTAGAEYAVKLSVALHGVLRREIYATCALSSLYRGDDALRVCADCLFTSLKEEDRRYLKEKANNAAG